MTRKGTTTIAILGGNTVAGHALSLLLRGAGYETTNIKAPPTGPTEDLLGDADLLLVSPGLREERRRESLAVVGGAAVALRIPVLAFASDVEDGLFRDEVTGAPWPVDIDGLVRAIEAALAGKPEIGPAIVADPVNGEAALS